MQVFNAGSKGELGSIMAKDNDKDKDKKKKDADDTGASSAPPKGPVDVVKQTVSEFMDDNCLNQSAAVAYYAIQSIIPLILGFLAVGSLFLQDPTTRNNFVNGVQDAIPSQLSSLINFNDLIENFIKGAGAVTIFSILSLLWTGSGIFDQLIFSANLAYDVEKDNRNFFVKLVLRIAMLLVLGGLLALAFGITIVLNLIFNAKIGLFGISPNNFSFILPVISYLVPLLIETLIFAILYKFGPARKGIKWKPVLVGGLVAAVLFEILKVGFTFYVSAFGAANSATKTYGAIGGIIVFLLFLYLCAAVILFGAELASVMQNFKSGMASVKTSEAVVEAKAGSDKNGAVTPAGTGKAGKGATAAASANLTEEEKAEVGANAGGTDFDYGTVEKPAAPGRLSYVPSQAEKDNPLTVITGAVVLIVAAAASAIFRRKTPAA